MQTRLKMRLKTMRNFIRQTVSKIKCFSTAEQLILDGGFSKSHNNKR